MKYKNLARKEAGYLLVESLFTLIILMAVILLVYPLAVSWLATYREAKLLVEENRVLYEESFTLNDEYSKHKVDEKYSVDIKKNQIRINDTGTEVVIYESIFEK